MTIPAWITSGAWVNDNTSPSVPWPSHNAGALGLLFVSTANEAVAAPDGWAELANSPQHTGTAGAAGGVRLHVFFRLAQSSSEANAVINGNYSYCTAQIHTVAGVDSASPIHQTAGWVDASGTTAMSWGGVTTSLPDCLLVLAAAMDSDANSTATCTGYASTSGSVISLTERQDRTVNTGAGGGLVVATGEMALPGATGTITATGSTAVTHAYLTIALAPAAVIDLAGADCSQVNSSAIGEIGQTHGVSGAGCEQANISASGAISQAHVLVETGCSQVNGATGGSIGQTHELAGGGGSQENISATGVVEMTASPIHLTGENSGQGNTSVAGAIGQTHELAGTGSNQGNTSGAGAISQSHQLAGLSCAQSNTTSSGLVVQIHSLIGAAGGQTNISAAEAISQTHGLAGTGSNQRNASATEAIAVGAELITLLGEDCGQGNTSEEGAISQLQALFECAVVTAPARQRIFTTEQSRGQTIQYIGGQREVSLATPITQGIDLAGAVTQVVELQAGVGQVINLTATIDWGYL